MFKTLLTSTALTALVATSAMAASGSETTAPKTEASMVGDQAVMDMRASLASDLIGSSVYGSAAEDAEMIGDINDIVIAPNGEVVSVVVGVGGFLGMGEKDVAVDYKTISWVDRNGQRWLVANISKEQLTAAPVFDREAVYTEARSTEQTADGMTEAQQTAARIEDGESATAIAEEKTAGPDRASLTPVRATDISADNLIGLTVYGATNESIGEIGDVLLTSGNQVEAFVLDVGGFLGLGEKPVAISTENLDIRSDAEGNLTVFTPFTQAELEAQQEYSKEMWEANRNATILIIPAG
ncbi:PRC-barrel domain-containing protein [Hoeflea sp.]|uniref:PRC-barrel domain-containing protein n=1 Tax=Hoeflea sp. TaxID=1940281 RepID=UPI003749FB5A